MGGAGMEKFCLKWNDFQDKIVSSFQDLRKDTAFTDVTLVCEEDQQIEAHQIILNACSPFFSRVLKNNKHSHPMIYMGGLKTKDLAAVMDYIYLGVTNIHQDDLEAFLALADELQLKGLSGGQNNRLEGPKQQTKQKTQLVNVDTLYQQEIYHQNPFASAKHGALSEEHSVLPFKAENMVPAQINTDDHKLKISSMIEIIGPKDYKCTVCGKINIGKPLQSITRHVETHIEGASYPCNQCGKVSRSSNAYFAHVSRNHRQ
jgi:hypothetical protein